MKLKNFKKTRKNNKSKFLRKLINYTYQKNKNVKKHIGGESDSYIIIATKENDADVTELKFQYNERENKPEDKIFKINDCIKNQQNGKTYKIHSIKESPYSGLSVNQLHENQSYDIKIIEIGNTVNYNLSYNDTTSYDLELYYQVEDCPIQNSSTYGSINSGKTSKNISISFKKDDYVINIRELLLGNTDCLYQIDDNNYLKKCSLSNKKCDNSESDSKIEFKKEEIGILFIHANNVLQILKPIQKLESFRKELKIFIEHFHTYGDENVYVNVQ
jgi:hypothetical protein